MEVIMVKHQYHERTWFEECILLAWDAAVMGFNRRGGDFMHAFRRCLALLNEFDQQDIEAESALFYGHI